MTELQNVTPSEIVFKEELFSSEYSAIFLVNIRDQTCVMKVHHGRGPPEYYEPKDRELDIHILESKAYHRLKQQGLCDLGIVPHFFGTMDKFDPRQCLPYLNAFVDDEYLPSAIFLEYIPNLEMIQLHNYTRKRMEGFIKAIREIHKALVRHKDPKPRNMMIVKDGPENRVVWLDFDRAETYDVELITEKQERLVEEEELIVTELRDVLELDLPKGKLDEALLFYCT